MSAVVIGAKDNLVKTNKNNTLTGSNTFTGLVNLVGTITGIDTNDVDGLQTALSTIQTDISVESSQRVSADTDLENSINNLLEFTLPLKLDKSRSIDSNLQFYATNRGNLSEVLSTISAQGSVLSLGSGSYGNLNDTSLVINKQNIAIHAPPTGTNICEILSPVTIPSTSDRLRFQGITFDGNEIILNASRSIYRRCDFTGANVRIGAGATGFITFRDCEFVAGTTITVSNTFASVCFFINCNFGNANLVLLNQSPTQIILNNNANYFAFPPNATYVGINVLPTGYITNNISKTILSNGSGNSGDVIVSGGANGLDSWLPLPTPPPIPPSGKCLEMIAVFPASQQITSVRGDTITFQNPVQSQALTQTFAVLEGSQIQYRPPSNTKTLIFTFYTHASNRNDSSSDQEAEFQCRFGNTNVTVSNTYIRLGQTLSNGFIEMSCIFTIDATQTENIANGILASFDNLTFIRFQGRCPVQNGTFLVNNKSGFIPFANPDFSKPRLKIEAYS